MGKILASIKCQKTLNAYQIHKAVEANDVISSIAEIIHYPIRFITFRNLYEISLIHVFRSLKSSGPGRRKINIIISNP